MLTCEHADILTWSHLNTYHDAALPEEPLPDGVRPVNHALARLWSWERCDLGRAESCWVAAGSCHLASNLVTYHDGALPACARKTIVLGGQQEPEHGTPLTPPVTVEKQTTNISAAGELLGAGGDGWR